MDRAAGHADDRQPGLGPPVPAEVVGHAHRAGRVARHRVDAAVGGAGADRQDRGRLRGQPVEPLAGRHRLAGGRVVAEAAPVALGLDRLVRDRALDHEHERLEFAAVGLVPPLDEVVGPGLRPALEVDQRPVHRDLRQARQRAERDLLDARLGRRRQRDGVTVAAQPAVHPEDVDRRLLGVSLRHRVCLCGHREATSSLVDRLDAGRLLPGELWRGWAVPVAPATRRQIRRRSAAWPSARGLAGGVHDAQDGEDAPTHSLNTHLAFSDAQTEAMLDLAA